MNQKVLNVLLVEDNASHAEIITRCLKQCNQKYMVHHVTDGEEAINFLISDTVNFENNLSMNTINLILIDLRIPKLDGIQVLKKIKSQTSYRSIPVIILTTSDDENDKRNAYQNFANSYLVKPIGFDEFKYLIMRVDEYWSRCNHAIHLN